MSYGYSSRLILANRKANNANLGVKLGRKCIKSDISVAEVAKRVGVSRMTVYNWFIGLHEPQPEHALAIADLINTLVE